MKTWQITLIIIIVCMALTIGLFTLSKYDAEENHSAHYEKGDGYCPNCGAKLVKGVYGAYTPHFVWYCPECP